MNLWEEGLGEKFKSWHHEMHPHRGQEVSDTADSELCWSRMEFTLLGVGYGLIMADFRGIILLKNICTTHMHIWGGCQVGISRINLFMNSQLNVLLEDEPGWRRQVMVGAPSSRSLHPLLCFLATMRWAALIHWALPPQCFCFQASVPWTETPETVSFFSFKLCISDISLYQQKGD